MKKSILSLCVILLCVLALSFVACGNNPQNTITVNTEDSIRIAVGEQIVISASVSGGGVITWTSENPSIAFVYQGIIEGKEVGKTNIILTSGDATKTISIEVFEDIPVTSVEFSFDSVVVEPNTSKALVPIITPSNATDTSVTFTFEPIVPDVSMQDGAWLVVGNVNLGTTFDVIATSTNGKTARVSVVVGSTQVDFACVDNKGNNLTAMSVAVDEPYRVIFTEPAVNATWTSSNEAVCTVNSKGRVTMIGEGNATITAKYGNVEKNVAVTVTAPNGDFIEYYHMPQSYINYLTAITTNETNGWHEFADFKSGGTTSTVAKNMVFENYAFGTNKDGWIKSMGNSVSIGGLDVGGLQDDDIEGGIANLYMWGKVKLGQYAKKLRAQFDYRSTGSTFKYKLRFTIIDIDTKEVTHLTDWQIGSKLGGDVVFGNSASIEADIPEKFCGDTVIIMLEYDDIDTTKEESTDGYDAVNIKSLDIKNDNGLMNDKILLVIGDSIMTTEFTNTMVDSIAAECGMMLVRDTISGSTIAPASNVGIVDHIDCGYYTSLFDEGQSPSIIAIQRGSNDLYWSSQAGNPLRMGSTTDTGKTTTYGAIRYIINYFRTTFPNAKIVWSTTIYRGDVDNGKITTFNSNLASICDEYENVYCFDLYTECGIKSTNVGQYLIADRIHPSVVGCNLLLGLWVTEINKHTEEEK